MRGGVGSRSGPEGGSTKGEIWWQRPHETCLRHARLGYRAVRDILPAGAPRAATACHVLRVVLDCARLYYVPHFVAPCCVVLQHRTCCCTP